MKGSAKRARAMESHIERAISVTDVYSIEMAIEERMCRLFEAARASQRPYYIRDNIQTVREQH
jgi:hypothetical protein